MFHVKQWGLTMEYDLERYFKMYASLSHTADEVFERVKKAYPECVRCDQGCADCCHALFDVTLIEALYINRRFHENFSGKRKADLLEVANQIDRHIYRLKRKAYRKLKDNQESEAQVLEAMAAQRARCPLLGADDLCVLYTYRPITCRLYGIPTAIDGKGHTCGKSAFIPGEPYPTVNLGAIQQKLYDISKQLIDDIQSRYPKLSEMLVPLSMALLTDYDVQYLGIDENRKGDQKRG